MQIKELLKITKINRMDAEILLAHMLHVSRTFLLTYPEYELSAQQYKQWLLLEEKRYQGEPVAYLTGKREFWSLDLKVTPDTLIPRPETELLVETVLNTLHQGDTLTIADLGTGSGAISLALAKERPLWRLHATDFSDKALAVAQNNAQQLNIHNITFYLGCWYEALTQRDYAAIVSNPPYIAENDVHLIQGDLHFEPKLALQSGPEGLTAIQSLITKAPLYLRNSGWLFLEHGYTQQTAIQEMFYARGFQSVVTYLDINQHPRITIGQWHTKE